MSSTATAAPTATAHPTPAPTPSATPSATDRFLAYLDEPNFTAVASVSGSMIVNGTPVDVDGTWEVADDNFRILLETHAGGASGEVEQVFVDGQNYIRPAPMPWRQSGAALSAGTTFASTLSKLDWDEPAWGADGQGQTQRLVGTGRRVTDVIAFLGLGDVTTDVQDAVVTVVVDGRARPTQLTVKGHGSIGEPPQQVEWDVVYDLAKVGSILTIKKPTPWVTHDSTELQYSMQYPEDWEVSYQPPADPYAAHDLYLGRLSGEVQVSLYTGLDPMMPANAWYQGAAASFTEWAGPIEESETITVAGAPALYLAGHTSDANGEWWVMHVSVVRGDRAWDITSWAEPGYETPGREMLDQFLVTFHPHE